MLKQNKGSLTVEASLSLIIFIFAFLSVIYLCKFAKAQIILQHAINQTAKEISQYSYISNKLGLQNDKTAGNNAIKETDKILGEVVDLINVVNTEKKTIEDKVMCEDDFVVNDYYDAIKLYKKYDEGGKIIKTSYENVSTAATTLFGEAKEYLKNPQALLMGFAAIAKDEIADFAVSKYIAAPMSRHLIQKYLPTIDTTADEYLKRLGIDNGLDGLNFDTSTIFKDNESINITVIYNMSLEIPLFPKRVLCFRLNASTIGWQSKLFYDTLAKGSDENSKSFVNIWDYGGEKTTDEFIKIISNERNLSVVRTPLSLDYYDNTNNIYTYVHSMNTELKSYVTDGILNISQIKSKIKYYAEDAIKDTKRKKQIIMDDGTVYNPKHNGKSKVIIVIQESACGNATQLNAMLQKIKKELEHDVEIELYYNDGLIEVKNGD